MEMWQSHGYIVDLQCDGDLKKPNPLTKRRQQRGAVATFAVMLG